jgi:hypothetical protein
VKFDVPRSDSGPEKARDAHLRRRRFPTNKWESNFWTLATRLRRAGRVA